MFCFSNKLNAIRHQFVVSGLFGLTVLAACDPAMMNNGRMDVTSNSAIPTPGRSTHSSITPKSSIAKTSNPSMKGALLERQIVIKKMPEFTKDKSKTDSVENELSVPTTSKIMPNSMTVDADQHGADVMGQTIHRTPSLGDDALQAAFASLSRLNTSAPVKVLKVPMKLDEITRVGVLVPLTGRYAKLGTEIRRGIEMALFKIGNATIEVLFFDTKGGERAAIAARDAVETGVEIFIGPLFSESVKAAREAIGDADIPMLMLSNNIEVAKTNNWVLGYPPEQQLDGLLGHAITLGKRSFAVIAQDNAFGRRLWAHANQRLGDFGLKAEAEQLLNNEELNDENNLKKAIRRFSRYVPSAEKGTLPESPFDVVIFAGDPDFALRIAPVLAYYDLGPDRALYLGNSLWDQQPILSEPSLQGGLFASRPTGMDGEFNSGWQAIWNQPPGLLSRLGFDSMALVAALLQTQRDNWSKELVSNQGFRGYSGAFRLLPNGRNIRAFELREISNGSSKIIKPAPDKI